MIQAPEVQFVATGDTIVNRAIPMFADKGYDGVSIRDISEAVGITAGAIYHHFSGKRELFDKAVERAFATVTQTVLSELPLEGTPRERMRESIRRFVRYNFSRPDEMRLVDRVIFDGEPLDFSRFMNQLRDAFAASVRDVSAKAPAEESAEHIIASVYGATKLQRVRAAFRGGDWFGDADAYAESLSIFTLRSLDNASI